MLNGNYNNYMPQYGAQSGNIPYRGMPVAPQGTNVPHGAMNVVPQTVVDKIPENIKDIDAEQIANNNGAVNAMSGADPKTMKDALAIYLPFIALRTLNDTPNPIFSFAGEWDKTFIGRLAHLGDTISRGFSKLIPDSIEDGVKNAGKAVKNFAQKHSGIVRSFSTPLKLENQTAVAEANGFLGRILSSEVAPLFEKGYKGDIVALFKDKGTNEFWNFLKLRAPDIETMSQSEASKVVADALKDMNTMPRENITGYVDDLINIFANSKERASIDYPILGKGVSKLADATSSIPVLNKVTGGLKKFLTHSVELSEASNKLKVSSGKAGATVLGCALPSAFAKIYEGLTSDFVGGKIAPYLQAFFLMQAVKKAKEAPEGKKLATFMDEETGAASYLITMPLATSLMTKLGGMKYIGMSSETAGKTAAELIQSQKNNVQQYRDLIKALNERVDAGSITRGEYVNEVKKIKDALKGNTKFWQAPFKFIGKICGSNYKAETIKPFIDNTIPADASKIKQIGLQASNMAQSFMYKLKTGGFKLPLLGSSPTPGGILRFALVMFVFSPLVTKPIKAVVNKIFGKPYDPAKEQQEAEKKAQAEALKNNPFNKMSDGELITLLSKNQNALQDLQAHPELMQEFQKNPQKFYDYLKQNADKYDQRLANAPKSSALNNYINKMSAQNNQMNVPNRQMTQQMQPMQQNNFMPMAGQPYSMTQTMSVPQNMNGWQNPYYNAQYNPQMSQMPYTNGYNAPYGMNGAIQPSNNFQNPNYGYNQMNGMTNAMPMMNYNQNAKMPAPNLQMGEKNTIGEQKQDKMVEAKRSYIPSSKPNNFQTQMQQQEQKTNAILQDMENTEREFSKYLNI